MENQTKATAPRSGFGGGFAKPATQPAPTQKPAEASASQAQAAMPATTQPQNSSLAQGNQNARNSVEALLKTQFKAIQSIIPKHLDPQRLARIALIEFQKNPALMACTPQSIVGCVLQAAMLGLEIGGTLGYCYMVPYKGVAQFQIGYKGLLKKARDTAEIKHIDAGIICQNDSYEFEKGLEPKCFVKFNFGQDRGPVIGYYACASFMNGGTAFEVMTKDEVQRFAKAKSKSFNNGPWQTDFDAMAIKTVIKRLSKWLPMNEAYAQAISKDEAILTDKVDLDVGAVEVDATVVVEENGERVDTETGEVS